MIPVSEPFFSIVISEFAHLFGLLSIDKLDDTVTPAKLDSTTCPPDTRLEVPDKRLPAIRFLCDDVSNMDVPTIPMLPILFLCTDALNPDVTVIPVPDIFLLTAEMERLEKESSEMPTSMTLTFRSL